MAIQPLGFRAFISNWSSENQVTTWAEYKKKWLTQETEEPREKCHCEDCLNG